MIKAKVTVMICLIWASCSPASPQKQPAQNILRNTGVKGGLVVHVGCGDGTLTAELCANERFVVHGLDTDAKRVTAARELLHQKGLMGRVSASRFDGKELPYADNLVRLLVAEKTYQVPDRELMRVLAPGGTAYIKNGSQWNKRVKPWPEDIDSWTHLLHGPDNNAVARDSVVGPPRRMQWKSAPAWCRSHEFISSFVSMVSDGGRIFFVFDEGLTGVTDPQVPERWTLIARDAFSGILLWKRPMKDWNAANFGGRGRGSVPPPANRTLVAQGDHVFTVAGFRGAVVKLDAATGAEIKQYAGTEGTEEIVVCDNALLVRTSARGSNGRDALVALRPDTGKLLWQRPEKRYLAESLAARDATLVYANREALFCLNLHNGDVLWSNKSPEFRRHSWSGGPRIVITEENVLVGKGRKILALDLTSGDVMWEQSGGGGSMRGCDMMVIDDLVWHASGGEIAGYDLKTGTPQRKLDPRNVQSAGHHLRCYPAKATAKYLITQFRGAEFVSLSGDNHVQNDWTRGACRYGVMPANGLLYVPPHPCFCYPGAMMTGLNVYAPASDDEISTIAEAANATADRVERGPAWAAVSAAETAATDWPMYRRDPRRSGATPTTVPDALTQKWQSKLGGELTQPVAARDTIYVADKNGQTLYALNVRNGSQRWHYPAAGRVDSAPTILGNMVLFGCADGYVYCLRATDGALAWRFRAAPVERLIVVDERVESAWPCHGSVLPHNGLIYFTTGRSSYLDGGVIVYALKPETGEVVHRTRLDTWSRTREDARDGPFLPAFHIEGARSDILVSEGGFIFLNQFQFTSSLELIDTEYRPGPAQYQEDRGSPDAFGPLVSDVDVHDPDFVDKETLARFPQMAKRWYRRGHLGARRVGRHIFATGGFLDNTYFHRIYWMYSNLWPGYYIGNVAPKTGQLLVVGPNRTYAVQAYPQRVTLSPMFTPGQSGYLLVADDNENDPIVHEKNWGRDKGMGISRRRPPVWSDWAPIRVRAMTLAAERLFVAGPPDVLDEKDPMASFEGRMGGLLRVYDADAGEHSREYKLTAPPVFDGMIAADGKLLIATTDGRVVCMTEETAK
jgi:outer membrane protein assembly factor BamB